MVAVPAAVSEEDATEEEEEGAHVLDIATPRPRLGLSCLALRPSTVRPGCEESVQRGRVRPEHAAGCRGEEARPGGGEQPAGGAGAAGVHLTEQAGWEPGPWHGMLLRLLTRISLEEAARARSN